MQDTNRSTFKHERRRGWLHAGMVALAILLLGGITWLAASDATVQAADSGVDTLIAVRQDVAQETATAEASPPATPTGEAQAQAVQQNAAISLTMTISSTNVCGTSTSAIIPVGGTAYICYRVSNTGQVSLTNHIIADASVSTVYASFADELPVYAENPLKLERIISAIITADETRTDTWIANNGTVQAQASASVTINAINPAISVEQRVGRSPTECSATSPYLVPASTPVYLCLTLTNTGDVALTSHAIYVSALAFTATVEHPLPPGASVNINNNNASEFGIQSLAINSVNSSIVSVIRSTSRTAEGFAATASASVSINVGNSRTTLAGAVRTDIIESASDCPATGSNNITTEINSSVWYCLHLTNTGNVALGFHHITAITPTVNLTITYNLPPNATVIITNGLLAQLGSPQVLGPHTAGRTLNSTFIITSTNNTGFRSVASTSITAGIFVPTNTPTPTNTSEPSTPTFTPSITLTPFPSQTPLPSWTPTFTPVAPTPTWTRSFAISSIDTPTPGVQAAQAEQIVPTVDTQATAFAEATVFAQETLNAVGAQVPTPDSARSVFDSPLAAPELALTMTQQANEALAGIVPVETPLPPTSTEIPTVTPTPSPSATPTPTPTATMRPIVLPTVPPPADVTTIFAQVLGSSVATTSIIFLITGTIVFFAVLGGVLGFGFLRNNSRRFELFETDEAGDDELAPATAPATYPPVAAQPKPTRSRRSSSRASGNRRASATPADDKWPSELP